MICWERVRQLRNDVGEECFREIVDAFLDEMDATTGKLAETTDAIRQRAQFHFLKGNALNLGFSELAGQCASCENATLCAAVSAGEIEEVVASYRNARSMFEAGLRELAG